MKDILAILTTILAGAALYLSGLTYALYAQSANAAQVKAAFAEQQGQIKQIVDFINTPPKDRK